MILIFSTLTMLLITTLDYSKENILICSSLMVALILIRMFYSLSNMLLCFLYLEVFMLVNVLALVTLKFSNSTTGAVLLIVFTLAVCEASMGLSLLVKLLRFHESSSLKIILHISLIKPSAFKAENIFT